jgi:glycosyltransferase involved in cell wall biosynthesis
LKLKATFLVSTISNGGAEGVCVNIANGLAERGWDVDLLVLHTQDKNYINRLSEKVNLIDLKVKRARYALPALLCYLFKNKPKHMVIFKYELIDLSIIVKKLFRLNTKLLGRNISIFSEVNSRKKASMYKKVINFFIGGQPIEQLDGVINQSYEMQKDLLADFPSLKSRSCVIHNPVSSVIEDYAKQHKPLPKNEPNYILCVGRLTEVKAFHHAIEAFSLIADKYPKLRLKFVGQGHLRTSLKMQSQQLGLQGKVDFEGFQADVIPFYRNASLTLLTSDYEGFPNVLIESIVLGTPVVSFDCPSGPREILDYCKYGKLVSPGDVSALALAIEDVLASPHQFNLTERAEFFSFDKAIDKYESLLEKFN